MVQFADRMNGSPVRMTGRHLRQGYHGKLCNDMSQDRIDSKQSFSCNVLYVRLIFVYYVII